MKCFIKHIAICVAALAVFGGASAQYVEGEVFPLVLGTHGKGHDKDHPWNDYDTSDRFVLYYSPAEANISPSDARTALNELEFIYKSYIKDWGFQAPFTNNPRDKKKMGAYVLRANEGYAFGGISANGPGMWLAVDAVKNKWVLAHEFMHGLQAAAGGFTAGSNYTSPPFEGNFVGWFHESHANMMPHWVYPGEIHYCAEMYTRMANLYLGSTRDRYCNWQFFEYIADSMGLQAVNDLWTKDNQYNDDVLAKVMRIHNIGQKEFGDLFGGFALKTVIWDMERGDLFRGAFSSGNIAAQFKRPRYTYLEALDSTDGANGRFVVPFQFAPQRYGYNIIRLYPESGAGAVTVRFRGDVQTKNNIPNYKKNIDLEPLASCMFDDPGSDWRYGVVMASASGTTARYSELARASDGNPDITMDVRAGEMPYLVVAATPTKHHKIKWDQFYYTIYRFPYMVEIKGAKPEGFQPQPATGGSAHANGGGFVASTAQAAATAYVGPNARVLGRAKVSDNARVEGRAVVQGGTVSENAVVRDYAFVNGGTISGYAVIAEGANVWNGTIRGSARVDGAANLIHSGISMSGNSRIGGVCWVENAAQLSGTAQFLGDGEVYAVTASKGVFYGLIEAATISDNQQGANRTEEPIEATAPRSMTWYGDSATSVRIAAKTNKTANSFRLNNRGVFAYSVPSGSGNLRLRMFDVRGRLVRTIALNGTTGTVNTRTPASQVLFWRVEGAGGKLMGAAGSGAVVR